MNEWNIEAGFPAIITSDATNIDYPEFVASLSQNKTLIADLLLKHGALLFRGFPVASPDDFAHFIEKLGLGEFVNYVGGDSPRDKVKDKVYTSTEAPPSLYIPLHQELSFIRHYPKQIYFYCQKASLQGGATIIGDARQVYRDLDENVKSEFVQKEITYVSRYYGKSAVMRLLNRYQRSHKSWREVFETDDKASVETKCQQNEFDYRWLPHDWIEIRQTRPAVTTHPETNEAVWFNQAHLYDFNPRLLGGFANYLAANIFYCRRNTRLHEVTFADGSKITRDALYHVFDVLDNNTINYPWQDGDVMVLDNVLSMHGRDTYTGKRRVLTALTA